MKRKVLLGAFLLGVFIFTSCVDDSESQSVTAIRQAQAEKIKAEAALATSQAKAEEIRATAEAALAQAQADAAKAEAKLKEAEAARVAAETESDKKQAEIDYQIAQEELRVVKANADLAVKQAEYDLEEMKLESEKKLLNLQQQLEILKNDDPVLREAIQNYSIFIERVNRLKMTIAGMELDLTKRKALLADAKAGYEDAAIKDIKLMDNDIADINRNITSTKTQIENYNVLLQKGGEGLDDEIAALKKKRDDLIYNKSADLYKSFRAKEVEKDAALQAVNDFRDLGTVKSYSGWWLPGYVEEVVYSSVPELNIQVTERKEYITEQKNSLKKLEEEYAGAESQIEALYTAQQAAIKASENAYKTYIEVMANAESTDEQKAAALEALNKANEKRDKAINNYLEAKGIVDNHPSFILNLKNYIAYGEAELAKLTEMIEAYGADSGLPRKLEEAYLAAYKAFSEARDEYYKVYDEIDGLSTTITELNEIFYAYGYWNVDDLKDQIKYLEENVAGMEGNIADLNRRINETKETNKVDIAGLDLDIQELEAEIAALKVELGVKQKQADTAKAVIDARTK